MSAEMKSFRIGLCLTLFLLAVTPVAAVHAQSKSIPCQRASALVQPAGVSATSCFRVTPPRGSTALRVDLAVSSGAYDLYVRPGSATALNDADKVNVGAISGNLTYVYPGTGPFTVIVGRTSSSGTARLSPVLYQPVVKCSGSMCTAAYPLTSIPGPQFDDQAVFEMPDTTAGQIGAKVTWTGQTRLSALLYGPAVTRAGIRQGTLARKDGASPLALSYGVRSTNLISRGEWSVALSNAGKGGGAVSKGTLTLAYPQ
jgi:hypothetical protein